MIQLNEENKLYPVPGEEVIPIVFAANSEFVPVFAVCFQSLLNQIDHTTVYDIVLIHSDISLSYCQTLKNMCNDFPNVFLRFYNANNIIKQYGLVAGGHITEETYYRFLIQDILPNYNKVIYLDCDLIICCNPAELFHIDVSDVLLAAARDPEFLGRINGANYSTIEYCKKDFPMNDPFQYFQAGVLLLNTCNMRKQYTLDQWLTFAQKSFKYHDQDVLNLYCEGQVRYLDMAWNVLTDCDHSRISDVISFAPSKIQEEYFNARKSPKILHYAGFKKPWFDPEEDFAQVFWKNAQETPFYEILLYRMTKYEIQQSLRKRTIRALLRKKIQSIGLILFPKNSKFRSKVKKIIAKNQWLCKMLDIMQ